MIKKFFLVITTILLLNSCSLDSIIALSQINKVQLVRTTTYTKEYRAYFARENLLPIKRGHKFLFYYNKHKKDLAILMHPRGEYIAYSITKSPNKVLNINSSKKRGYRYTNRLLRKYGYRQVTPTDVGYKTSLSRRIFKGHKTYYLRAINYQKLISKYKQAIRSYNYAKVKHIKTKLPTNFISSYFKQYEQKASTTKQKEQIQQIGIKLGLRKHLKTKKQTNNMLQQNKTDETKPLDKLAQQPHQNKQTKSLYEEYNKCQSYAKLHKFLHSKQAKESLSYAEFSKLSYKEAQLREKELLANGSIEELIAEYKKTNNPRYKKKAMELMKKVNKS